MMEKEQPVQTEYQAIMASIATSIDNFINPNGNKVNGFCLFLFPFGQPNDEHRCNYMSNASREDMIAILKEFIARYEGRFEEKKGPTV